MTEFEDFLRPGDDSVTIPANLERVDGASYQCIFCSGRSIEVLFDRSAMVMYWYCSEGHESKVEIGVGKD